jgi:hypothetical protein
MFERISRVKVWRSILLVKIFSYALRIFWGKLNLHTTILNLINFVGKKIIAKYLQTNLLKL